MDRRRGVTIIELVIVLAILAGLLALLFPALQSARERARETVCRNNVHQLNLALARYAEAHKQLPAPSPPGLIGGWMVAILPFIEQQNLELSIPIGLPVDDAPAGILQPPSIYLCPRRTTIDGALPPSVRAGHYVFVPAGRESFLLFDAPTDLRVPWITGPTMQFEAIRKAQGPHSDGFYFARGFQQGVSYMLNGQEMR